MHLYTTISSKSSLVPMSVRKNAVSLPHRGQVMVIRESFSSKVLSRTKLICCWVVSSLDLNFMDRFEGFVGRAPQEGHISPEPSLARVHIAPHLLQKILLKLIASIPPDS